MSSVADIRKGLAANLVSLRDAGIVGHVTAYSEENPTTPALMVSGIVEYEYTTFGGPGVPPGMRYLVMVEAALGAVIDLSAQDLLNDLLESEGASSLVAAAEADTLLVSRLQKDGTVDDAQAAAQSVSFEEYRGQTRFPFAGVEVLLASWVFEVLT